MKNLSKTFKWLSTFKKEEKQTFLLSLRKLNKIRSTRTKKLVLYLWECSENDSEPKIEVISTILYKKATFDKGQMRNYLKKTWDFVEDFLVQQHMQDELRRKQALQELAEERNIQDQFKEINNELISNDKLHIGIEGLLKKYVWQSKKYFSDANLVGKIKKSRIEFKQLNHTLEQVYVIARLQLCCEQQSRISAMNDSFQHELSDELKATIESFQEEIPVIKLYYQIYLLLSNKASIKITELEKLFQENSHSLSKNEQLQVLIYISNYLIINYNKVNIYNDKEDINLLLKFYRLRLKKEDASNPQQFNPYLFINITQIYVVQQEFDDAESFITTYTPLLPNDVRIIVSELCKAILLHKKKQFKAAFSILDQLKSRDLPISLRLYTYRIMCLVDEDFFKNNDKEIVREALNVFKRWLDSNEHFFGINTYKLYHHFILFAKEIISNDVDKTSLTNRIKETEYVGAKNWLLRKVAQLK